MEEQGEIVAAWPTVQRQTRFGTVHSGARLTPFLGPLLAPDDDPARRRSLEVRCLDLLVDELGPFAHLEARCNPAFDYWAPLSWRGFTQTTLYTWRPDRPHRPRAGARRHQEQRPRRHPQGRAPGRRGDGGLHRGVRLDPGEDGRAQGLRRRRGQPGAASGSTPPRPRAGRATILVARGADGQVHAGAYLVHDDRFTYYLAGGSDPALRTSGAGSLVVWAAIRAAAERGLAFDFEGSMIRGRREVLPGVRRRAGAVLGRPRDPLPRAARRRPVKKAARRLTRRR